MMTHTFVVLKLTPEAYKEIKNKLLSAGYQHLIHTDGSIDMSGIAVKCEQEPPKQEIPPKKRRKFFSAHG